MANPNPRILVNRAYATSVYVGDIIALGSYEEAQAFLNGVANLIVEHFGSDFIAASFDRKAMRGVFVFKKLQDAKKLERDWQAVVAYYENR